MTGSQPKASIIVLSYNQRQYTQMCLESILAHSGDVSYELIVVDNASSDDSPEFLKGFAAKNPGVRLILNRNNEGFARGNNIGVRASKGEAIILLNNDTVVTAGWLSGLLRHLEDPLVGMVGPVTNSSGNETRIRVSYQNLEDMPEFARSYTQAHVGQANPIRMLPLLCAALRRSVWDEIGPLDEDFGIGMFEDDDYAMRLHQGCYKILCAEDVFVHHWGSAGFKRIAYDEYMRLFQENRALFEAKWDTDWIPTRYREDLLDDQLSTLYSEKIDLANNVIDLNRRLLELYEIKSTREWHLILFVRRSINKLMPPGSRREKIGMRLLEFALGIYRFLKSGYFWVRNRRQGLAGFLKRGKYRKQLDGIVSQYPDRLDTFIFTPTLEWGIKLFQRPHHLAQALARKGCLVFFCEPPGVQTFPDGFHLIEDRLFAANLSLDVFKRLPNPAVVTLVYNSQYLSQLPQARVVYDHIDDIKVFHGDYEANSRAHHHLVCSADLVIATAGKLYQETVVDRPDTLLCQNGVELDFIREQIAQTVDPPEDIADLVASGNPIIGYYGALSHWFDVEMVNQAARERPDYNFLLIGPDLEGSIPKTRMIRRKNVTWIGPRPYVQIPSYLKYFTVATIPFRINEITHATSPLKLFEYFAGQKPVVASAMQEVQKYPLVLIASGRQEFPVQIDRALELRHDPAYLDSLLQAARENTWEQRAESILQALPAQKRNPEIRK